MFKNICSIHTSHASSGFNDDDIINSPHTVDVPYYAMPIYMPKFSFLQQTVNVFGPCHSVRVCNETYELMLVNAYMPYKSDDAAANEFSSVLADRRAISMTVTASHRATIPC